MLNTSVAPWPSYSEEEQQAVARVLESGKSILSVLKTREFNENSPEGPDRLGRSPSST